MDSAAAARDGAARGARFGFACCLFLVLLLRELRALRARAAAAPRGVWTSRCARAQARAACGAGAHTTRQRTEAAPSQRRSVTRARARATQARPVRHTASSGAHGAALPRAQQTK
jgi:hypothetical protein